MDPVTAVGLVASILQLVAAAKSVLDLGRDAANGPKEQRDLLLEVENLASLLEDLKHRVQQPNNQTMNGLQKLEKPLGQIKETMEHINRKLGSAKKVGSRTLIWAFWSKKEVDEDLAKIERFKTVLNAWLILDNWDIGQQQEKNYNQLRTELGTISHNQREYHDEIAKTLTSSSNMQRQEIDRTRTEVKNVAQNQQDLQDLVEREKIVKERKEIFDWLSPPNFFVRHADIFETRQEGTGLWFLRERKFQDWLSLGGTLWCRGIPGAGKTVLASIVVDYLRNELQGNSTGVAAAYLNHKESEVQSPSNILAGLWWQLVAERPISPVVRQLYGKHQNQRTRPSLVEVREILRSTVAVYSKLFIVVDALDEYSEAHRDILLKALAAMGGSVSLMLTSRPNIASESFFPTASVVEIRAKKEDIRRYVEAQTRNSFRLSKHVKARPELRDEIETKIAENADGMFLLAKLHIDSLTTKSTVKAVRDALQNLPEDLEHTYDEAMDRIEAQNKDDREIARRTLMWIANAKRPLTVFELQEALAIGTESKTLDADGLLDSEIILSVCVGLVIVDSSKWFGFNPRYSIVRLVHLTIQDYLDRVQSTRFPEAQTEITRQCLTCISYYNICDLNYEGNGLLSYASSYCLLHAAGEPELVLQDSIIQFLGDAHRWRARFPIYEAPLQLQWHYQKWPELPSRLWVAALFGLQHIAGLLLKSDQSISEEEKEASLKVASQWKRLEVVQLLITHGTNGNAQLPFIGNILRAASTTGDTTVVQLLIEKGADVNLQGGHYGTALQGALAKGGGRSDVNLQGGYYGTALQAASKTGDIAVVQLLIEKGADVNLQGGYYGTALQAASAQRQLQVVQLLLDHGADVNLQGGQYATALQAASAAWERQEGVVQLLLENGAEVNLQGGLYGTALQAASAEGYFNIVQLLLEHGANVNLLGGKYGTALQAALVRRSMEVVELLLKCGAGVKAQGGEYGTALQAASCWGRIEVVQFLLENGADVKAQGGEYDTALQAASMSGSIAVVQLLLAYGADVNMQGGAYGTALQAASAEGYLDIVQLLLEYGAGVNVQGGYYGTAVQAASWRGRIHIVQLLLEHEANVNAPGGKYGTALQAASWRGGMDVVRLLLEYGANVNVQGGKYGTALQAASARGSMEVSQLLLEHGAGVNLKGGHYGTALQAASVRGYTTLVQLLLEHGAGVNLHGGYFGTALQAASAEGEEEVVQLLLRHGADVNLQGGAYGTAYRAAKLKGRTKMAKLLVDHGADTSLDLNL
ncbi:ankyrin repeat-containing domain protein [Mycena rebaudengoi]|nr:ankyrin repeat-containing domain protein [Mycena rebaudengoi]